MNLLIGSGLIVAFLGINHLYIQAVNSIEGAPRNYTDVAQSLTTGAPLRTPAQPRESLLEKGLQLFGRARK